MLRIWPRIWGVLAVAALTATAMVWFVNPPSRRSAPVAIAEEPMPIAPSGLAVAAKVIGLQCGGALTPDEVAEIDAYIGRVRAGYAARSTGDRRFADALFPSLEKTYSEAYGTPERCTTEAHAFARDMLDRVRRAKQGG
ncbi:MAG: hypothetical protein F9K29_23225 [Hyphomicrobiaceae bacterium]|nr:MAG: hypothetical protein F9K29_23225 [Hyphomicrobiaceae bacterium]